ncbi:ORF6N domain-containing protein [Mucilaginibacter robiniae]|uniref:ORF6N domain-containing protein n=1 Tax=Mucilaginibacter robiniae TaxID=2728022 RepID=A0A7L5DYB6_9SPHI|nr:ORF6N domain-containing protein [Mucilaginibacter robiniae]QJD96090.1 ORF6N domain-containing protein [Mucilaginibacter robiniae]
MDIQNIPQQFIAEKIFILRGKKVMLDRDLAELYQTPTKRLNEKVKRNIARFPEDFMFQINNEEKQQLIEQFEHFKPLKFSSTLPYAFTEHGAVMLASVLNSEIAIAVNIQIVRVFIALRSFLSETEALKDEVQRIIGRMQDFDDKFDLIFNCLDELISKKTVSPPRSRIGYKPDNIE